MVSQNVVRSTSHCSPCLCISITWMLGENADSQFHKVVPAWGSQRGFSFHWFLGESHAIPEQLREMVLLEQRFLTPGSCDGLNGRESVFLVMS